jgi:transketolase
MITQISDEERVLRVSLSVLLMANKFGSAHVSSAITLSEILVSLFKLKNGNNLDIILSKGHGVACWYATLCEFGIINQNDLLKFNQPGSKFSNHIPKEFEFHSTLGTGSLGHGLSYGAGIAIARKNNQTLSGASKVFVILGDGEINEGSIWEGAAIAGSQSLGHLTAIVDCNSVQAAGQYLEISRNQDLRSKFESFGWNAFYLSTVSVSSITAVINENMDSQKPVAILANTAEINNFETFRKKVKWHYESPSIEEIKKSLHDISSNYDFSELFDLFL